MCVWVYIYTWDDVICYLLNEFWYEECKSG
jgi:hypothetical protein